MPKSNKNNPEKATPLSNQSKSNNPKDNKTSKATFTNGLSGNELILLKTIINYLPDAIYAKDLSTRKTISNLADVHNMGLNSEEEVLGKNDFDIYPKEIAEKFYEDDRMIIETGNPVINREEFFIDPKGKKRWLLTSKLPLKDENSNIIGLIGISRDITDRKLADEELKRTNEKLEKTNKELNEANEIKSRFLANMSHEIRTPLNAVIGMTGLLLDTVLDNEQRDFAETILDSGNILLSLINDILDFSKIEAQKIELENQPFDIRVCIEEALDLVASKAEDKNIELAYSIEDGISTKVIGDVTRLRQILINLLSNAIKFTEEGEVIVSVTGQLQDNYSCIFHFAVRDTGIGISPNLQNILFKSFSQVDASTTRKFGGTGLGLAISKNLSELMGGSMWVDSSGIRGEGSTFHFTVIMDQSKEKDSGLDLSPLNGRKVLIVDDNKTNRDILLKQMEALQMIPSEVPSGFKALEILVQGNEYDLMILDYHMPGMDGIELAKEIHNIFKEKTPPLILLSSYKGREGKDNLFPFSATLTKPIKFSHLQDVLLAVMNKRGMITKKYDSKPMQLDGDLGKRYPLRILVAEDNMINQKVVMKLLERLGYRADKAFNGIEVLDALKRQPYDLILMDVQMPNMDGEQATIEIQKMLPEKERPNIIAMTANALKTDLERYLTIGMQDYLVKPFNIEDLVKILIESPRLQDY